MKKLLSILLIISLVLSFWTIGAFADEGTASAVAFSYEGAHDPGIWLNRFDEEGNCNVDAYAVFNAAAPFTAIILPAFYAGRSENDQDADVRIELFKFTGDKAESLAKDPIFTTDDHLDGDITDYTIDFGQTIAAGQYILRVSELSTNPEHLSPGPYAVLPIAEHIYASDHIDFVSYDDRGFVFQVVYDGSVAADAFFKPLELKTPNYFKDDKAVQIVTRQGDNAHQIVPMSDYAILTPEIPEGKVLRKFTFKNAPTWNNTNHDSDLDWEVYVWDTDYDTTYGGKPIKSGTYLDHTDNADMTLDFGAKLTAGRRYLIVVYPSNEGKVGFWTGASIRKEGWEFFENDEETEIYPACEYKYSTYSGPEETEAPTEEPTPTPYVTEAPEITEAPATEVPTDVPPTDAPAPTEAPTEEPKQTGSCGGFIAGGFVCIGVLAAVAFVARKKD